MDDGTLSLRNCFVWRVRLLAEPSIFYDVLLVLTLKG